MSHHRLVGIGVILAWLAMGTPVGAHRLDEYLQATRIAIDGDHVGIEIDLTAGASIAPQVFALIDVNRDGRISDGEGDDYARRVLTSVSLSVDGRPARVTLDARSFPELEEMNLGSGIIRLHAQAEASSGVGRHQLVYFNGHAPDASVYLVNALLPSDTRVQITGQRRDPVQRGLTLDYQVSPDSRWVRGGWLLTAVAMLGVLRKRAWSGLKPDTTHRRSISVQRKS